MESRGRIILAQFNWRAIILAKDTTVLHEISGDIQGVWGDGETGAESVGAWTIGRTPRTPSRS